MVAYEDNISMEVGRQVWVHSPCQYGLKPVVMALLVLQVSGLLVIYGFLPALLVLYGLLPALLVLCGLLSVLLVL